jgi:hypothetical protein
MGRAKRADDRGMIFHGLNRANARATIFQQPEDDASFERLLGEALERVDMRVLAYCLTGLPFRTFALQTFETFVRREDFSLFPASSGIYTSHEPRSRGFSRSD